MAMDALEVSALQGSLVVQKQIHGDIMVTGSPVIMLSSNRPQLVATGTQAVRALLAQSNIRDLVRKRLVAVVL